MAEPETAPNQSATGGTAAGDSEADAGRNAAQDA